VPADSPPFKSPPVASALEAARLLLTTAIRLVPTPLTPKGSNTASFQNEAV
jgi:hypothetical protein